MAQARKKPKQSRKGKGETGIPRLVNWQLTTDEPATKPNQNYIINIMSQTIQAQTLRSISAIARDIRADWKKVNYAAKPYLQAMLSINYNGDTYGCDTAENIVRYFLCNASTYRGENAKALKAELKTVCGFTK